jgi:8-oxo-dGTP diphosphatase
MWCAPSGWRFRQASPSSGGAAAGNCRGLELFMTGATQTDLSRRELIDVIAAITPGDEIEVAHKADALGWIESGAEIYRLRKPATPPKHLVVYAAILDQTRRSVFLIEHRLSGLWLPTGGHADPGEPPFLAAQRELLEETGATLAPFAARPLFITVTQTVGCLSHRHTDVTLWYGFVASSGERFTLDAEECAGGAWFETAELNGLACEPHLARFMQKVGLLR